MKNRISFLTLGTLFLSASLAVLPKSANADRLKDMVSPITHPVNFEDPRHSSELRPLYVYHKIDDKFVTEGGNAQVYALQARFKVNDDFSIIATKDGYVDLNPDAVVPEDTGFADVGLGFKYSFFRTGESIATAGLRYEIPLGDEEVLQGQGDGMFNPFVSAATAVDNWNLMAGTGFRLRVDSTDSSFYDLDLHASYKMDNFYPLVEFGLVHVIAAGDRLGIPDEGEDFFNFGASESDGETLVTAAVGARYRINDDLDVGAAWQFPLNDGAGTRILDHRVTADMIWRWS